MNSDRIKEIQEQTAYPESHSVMQALNQVWNECEQKSNKAIADIQEIVNEFSKESKKSMFTTRKGIVDWSEYYPRITCIIQPNPPTAKRDHDFVEELRMYFEKTPREKVLEDWEKTKEVEIPEFPLGGYAKITRTSMKIEGILESDKNRPLKIVGRKGSQLILDGICRGVEWEWCEPCFSDGRTKPDLSIINDTDWFYVEAKVKNKWIFKGKMFVVDPNSIAFCITSNYLHNYDLPLCKESDITLIRKATDQDLASLFENYPEYAPKPKPDLSCIDFESFYKRLEPYLDNYNPKICEKCGRETIICSNPTRSWECKNCGHKDDYANLESKPMKEWVQEIIEQSLKR